MRIPTIAVPSIAVPAIAVLVALVVGCSESEPSAGGGNGGDASHGAGGEGGGEGPNLNCPTEPPDDAVEVDRVTGRLLDQTGAPIGELQTTVCGSECFNGRTDAEGHFTVAVGCAIPLGDYSVVPHGRPLYAGFYFAFPHAAENGEVALGDLVVLTLPESGPELVVKTDDAGAPAQSVTSNGVTLEVPEGVRVELEFDDVLAGDAGKQFRALLVDSDVASRLLDNALEVVALYAFNPFDATFTLASDSSELTKITVSFPNDAALEPATAVEVLALGSYLYADWVTPAAFEVVATGTVTEDGSRIVLDPGEGIEHLTWLAIRER